MSGLCLAFGIGQACSPDLNYTMAWSIEFSIARFDKEILSARRWSPVVINVVTSLYQIIVHRKARLELKRRWSRGKATNLSAQSRHSSTLLNGCHLWLPKPLWQRRVALLLYHVAGAKTSEKYLENSTLSIISVEVFDLWVWQLSDQGRCRYSCFAAFFDDHKYQPYLV
jgi:hypothetical protein